MIKTFKENDEVLYSNEEFISVSKNDIHILKKLADKNIRKRVRLCAHKSPNEKLHEMIIVHSKDCYVRPHCHVSKAESIFVIEGEADLIIFNEQGKIKKIVALSNNTKNGIIFHRQHKGTIHMIIIKSDYFVFHEVTEGPFKREDTFFPPWAPEGNNIKDNNFIKNLNYNI
jgi:cupin fold WbuC family metalloprotein